MALLAHILPGKKCFDGITVFRCNSHMSDRGARKARRSMLSWNPPDRRSIWRNATRLQSPHWRSQSIILFLHWRYFMPQLLPIHFEAGNVDITLTPPNSLLSISQALLDNQPFPDNAFQDEAIPLDAIKASANKEIKLDKVKFSAGGSLFSGFGVYRSSRKLFDALRAEGLDEPMVGRLDFPDLSTKNIFALRWGYDARGTINGAVALGLPGQPGVSFGASGSREGLYALLRLMDRNAKALDAIGETLNSWKMPRQISVPGDLKPGTWVIAETDGEIRLTLGLTYGYNYRDRKSTRLNSSH